MGNVADKTTDKIACHQRILTEYIEELAHQKNTSLGSTADCIAITDTVHHHYQLTRLGWDDREFLFSVLLHFSIKSDGKVWIQQNNTEILVGKDLEERGVDKSDIVIGFRPEYLRAGTGYAVG